MSWIGGILGKGTISQSKLEKKLAIMVESSGLAIEPSAKAYAHCVSSPLAASDQKALSKIFFPVERTSPRHPGTGYQDERLALVYDGFFYDLDSKLPKLTEFRCNTNEACAEFLMQVLAQLPGSLEQKVKKMIANLDGDYVLAVKDAEQIVIARNLLGTRPLYYGESDGFCAFASNKKPLWRGGLGEVKPVRAGMLAVLDCEGVSKKRALPLRKSNVQIKDMTQAVNAYAEVLRAAVEKRLMKVQKAGKVGVLLSGGVDSCLIAKLVCDAASGLGMEVVAYTVGLSDSPDVSFAREFARESGIEHKIVLLDIDEIERYIARVVEAIEDSDFVQVETGIPTYVAVDAASRDGAKVLFSGQGPDELWGGYDWYSRVLARDGREELCRRMWDDFVRSDIETLDRENKIAMAHGVELFFPYLDTEVVNIALSVASELKVVSGEDCLGKHPHRELAIKMGICEKYATRAKLAIQHGTGIHGLLDEIARKNGFTPEVVEEIGYKSDKITSVRLGSSARYGYRYTEKQLWQVPQHMQLFLHALAYQKGLLNESVRQRVERFSKKGRLPAICAQSR